MNAVYRVRGLLMVPPMILITLITWGECENELCIWGIGGATFILGLALRVWAQMHLHYRLESKKTLTTTGPYACVRNPIYIANTAMLAGACMLAELFWFVPVQVLYCAAVYALVVRHEEARLAAKYGAPYREYLASVPRWFPRLRPLARATDMGLYFVPSLLVEAHNLLLLVPFLVKEAFVR